MSEVVFSINVKLSLCQISDGSEWTEPLVLNINTVFDSFFELDQYVVELK